jgi:hypothetical protein
MAECEAASGRVIACDLQHGMLDKLGAKLKRTELEARMQLRKD